MTDKVKTVIESYFLLPDFKSRGHPSPRKPEIIESLLFYMFYFNNKPSVKQKKQSLGHYSLFAAASAAKSHSSWILY